MNLNIYQIVFMLFFAIFWGAIANVQPGWKAFQWPLFFKLRYARNRVILSVCILNITPLIFFGYVMYVLSRIPSDFQVGTWFGLIIQAVIAAFGIFGFYRLWLGIVELYPDSFYAKDLSSLSDEYHHNEPTYIISFEERKTPVVNLGKDTGCCNILFAVLYIVIACVTPWFRI